MIRTIQITRNASEVEIANNDAPIFINDGDEVVIKFNVSSNINITGISVDWGDGDIRFRTKNKSI